MRLEGLHPVYLALICLLLALPLSARRAIPAFQGRSSGFPALLATFPLRSIITVVLHS